jgi:hypothetical protein
LELFFCLRLPDSPHTDSLHRPSPFLSVWGWYGRTGRWSLCCSSGRSARSAGGRIRSRQAFFLAGRLRRRGKISVQLPAKYLISYVNRCTLFMDTNLSFQAFYLVPTFLYQRPPHAVLYDPTRSARAQVSRENHTGRARRRCLPWRKRGAVLLMERASNPVLLSYSLVAGWL